MQSALIKKVALAQKQLLFETKLQIAITNPKLELLKKLHIFVVHEHTGKISIYPSKRTHSPLCQGHWRRRSPEGKRPKSRNPFSAPAEVFCPICTVLLPGQDEGIIHQVLPCPSTAPRLSYANASVLQRHRGSYIPVGVGCPQSVVLRMAWPLKFKPCQMPACRHISVCECDCTCVGVCVCVCGTPHVLNPNI